MTRKIPNQFRSGKRGAPVGNKNAIRTQLHTRDENTRRALCRSHLSSVRTLLNIFGKVAVAVHGQTDAAARDV